MLIESPGLGAARAGSGAARASPLQMARVSCDTSAGDTAYGYYEATNYLERVGGPSGQPGALAAIWRVIKVGVSPQRARELLRSTRRRAAAFPLRCSARPLRILTARASRHRCVARQTSAAHGARRPVGSSPPPEHTELLVYALSALRHFDTGTGTRPVGAERTSGSMRAADAPRHAEPGARRRASPRTRGGAAAGRCAPGSRRRSLPA